MKRIIAIVFAISTLCIANAHTASATTLNNVVTGRVEHISTTNIKVYDPNAHHVLSFLLVPKFKRVFSDDGKTTYQMAKIHNGSIVRVYFDQKFLGARHADRIVVLTHKFWPVARMGS
ncbi:MAG TPA: hypothetical protein VGD50_07755 [Candidatus Baltobacteraceae bacterium]